MITLTILILIIIHYAKKNHWFREYKFPEERNSTYAETICATTRFDEIDNMDGHAFEHWCAAALKANRFTNVSVTKGSGDQGVDVLAQKDGIKYAIQCKCYSRKLTNKPVQEVYTGKDYYGCEVGVVMTNSYFTSGAIDLAKSVGVELWDRTTIAKMMNV